MHKYIKGLLLALAVTWAAYALSGLPSLKSFSLSPIIVAILLGMLVKNSLGVRRSMQDGVKLCAKKVLRLAIILLGFKLSLAEVGSLGLRATLLIVIVSTATLLVSVWLGRKLGIAKHLALLIGAGSSICGASAVIAVDAVSPHPKEEDVAFAIGVVTIFGTLFMLLYPVLFKVLGLSQTFYGVWTGLSVHEVAQVVGAGFAVSQEAGAVATIVKLTRVLFIIPVTLWLSISVARSNLAGGKFSLKKVPIPWFVVFFIGVVLLNSTSLLGPKPTAYLVELDNYLMTVAMAALGLETSFLAMKKVGLKPLYLGAASSVFIAVLSFFLIQVVL